MLREAVRGAITALAVVLEALVVVLVPVGRVVFVEGLGHRAQVRVIGIRLPWERRPSTCSTSFPMGRRRVA
jgi:hypothetical protein